MFKDLATTYASNHEYMQKGSGLCGADNFPGGITNGAKWYVVKGGMQDFNYLFSNCFEITIELSCCKYPLVDDLPIQWNANKKSLVEYLLKVHQGIKGHVIDRTGEMVQTASIFVENIAKPINTTENGEYWRLLTPGKYTVKAKDWKTGMESESIEVNVTVGVKIVDFKIGEDSSDPGNGAPSSCSFYCSFPIICTILQYLACQIFT